MSESYRERLIPLIEHATANADLLNGTGTYSEHYWHGVRVGLEIALEEYERPGHPLESAGADAAVSSPGLKAGVSTEV